MKKIVPIVLATIVLLTGIAAAEELMPGQKASAWSFPDADGKIFTMASWADKVLVINYVDPDEADLNDPFTDAVKKAKDDGLLREKDYAGVGIADCASTWKPNMLIRAIAGRKAKTYKSVILFDTDASLRNAWGLAADTSNIIILDKGRVCRAIVRGRVPDNRVEELIKLITDLQDK